MRNAANNSKRMTEQQGVEVSSAATKINHRLPATPTAAGSWLLPTRLRAGNAKENSALVGQETNSVTTNGATQ